MLQFKTVPSQESSYGREAFLFRLRKLQKVVAKSGIDGMLVINGIDSKRNEENEKITKWLLLGLNGLDILNAYMDEVFDELVMLITPDKVHFYLEQPAYHYIAPFNALPGVEVFLNAQEDQDLQEVEKIAFFLRVIK